MRTPSPSSRTSTRSAVMEGSGSRLSRIGPADLHVAAEEAAGGGLDRLAMGVPVEQPRPDPDDGEDDHRATSTKLAAALCERTAALIWCGASATGALSMGNGGWAAVMARPMGAPRSRRRPAWRCPARRPPEDRGGRGRSIGIMSPFRSIHCAPRRAGGCRRRGRTVPSRRREATMTAVIGSRKARRRMAPSPPRHSAGAARAVTDRELLDPDRVAQLQHLGIGHACIGHMCLDCRRSVEPRPRADAAADRLVILATGIAE